MSKIKVLYKGIHFINFGFPLDKWTILQTAYTNIYLALSSLSRIYCGIVQYTGEFYN